MNATSFRCLLVVALLFVVPFHSVAADHPERPYHLFQSTRVLISQWAGLPGTKAKVPLKLRCK